MSSLQQEIGIKMPGNRKYIDDYLEEVWSPVTALTSAIERFDAPLWLTQMYQEYTESLEEKIKKRLIQIKYDIDTLDTVHLITGGDHIERTIFVLLALVLRRHLAKFHICLEREMDEEELYDDSMTIRWLTWAAWRRHLILNESFQQEKVIDIKQRFEWFSAGLFKNYNKWANWMNDQYFADTDANPLSGEVELSEFTPEELENILIHEPIKENVAQAAKEADTKEAEMVSEITGTYFGYMLDNNSVFMGPMEGWRLVADKQASQDPINVEANGITPSGKPWRLKGTLNTAEQEPDYLPFRFTRAYEENAAMVVYDGKYGVKDGILSGSWRAINSDLKSGSFFLKETPNPSSMVFRPYERKPHPKALWSFALNTIEDSLRKSRFSRTLASKRTRRINRLLRLLYKERTEVNKFNEEEKVEIVKLQASFTPSEYRELIEVHQWHFRMGNPQPAYTCDNCGAFLHRARILCLVCKVTRSVDYCKEISCIDSATVASHRPESERASHQTSHLLMKTRNMLLLRDYYSARLRGNSRHAVALSVWQPSNALPDPILRPAMVVDGDKSQTTTFRNALSPSNQISNPVVNDPNVEEGISKVPSVSAAQASSGLSDEVSERSEGEEDPRKPSESDVEELKDSRETNQIDDLPDDDNDADDDNAEDNDRAEDDDDESDDESKENGEEDEEDYDDEDYDDDEEEGGFGEDETDYDDISELWINQQVAPVTLHCLYCKRRVSSPCWYCCECKSVDAFVCDSCEMEIDSLLPWHLHSRYRKELKSEDTEHHLYHTLIRFREGGKDNVEAEEVDEAELDDITLPRQLERIEQRVEDLRQNIEKQLDERLAQAIAGFDAKLTGIEALLSRMVSTSVPVAEQLPATVGRAAESHL